MKKKKLKYFDINTKYNNREKKNVFYIDLDFLSFAVCAIVTDKLNREIGFQVDVAINDKFFETAKPKEKLDAYHRLFVINRNGEEKINLPDKFMLYIHYGSEEKLVADNVTKCDYPDSSIFDYMENLKEIIIKMYNIE